MSPQLRESSELQVIDFCAAAEGHSAVNVESRVSRTFPILLHNIQSLGVADTRNQILPLDPLATRWHDEQLAHVVG